jgi:hypothetical protein
VLARWRCWRGWRHCLSSRWCRSWLAMWAWPAGGCAGQDCVYRDNAELQFEVITAVRWLQLAGDVGLSTGRVCVCSIQRWCLVLARWRCWRGWRHCLSSRWCPSWLTMWARLAGRVEVCNVVFARHGDDARVQMRQVTAGTGRCCPSWLVIWAQPAGRVEVCKRQR